MGRTVLITGASSGIGKSCAVHLAAHGWSVFAGVRKAADGEGLRAAGITPIIIDVTSASSIAAAAEQLRPGLCALVNNAGISVNGPLELVPLDEWRRQFEVNFFGHIAVTQAMLPLLKAYAAANPGPQPARIVMMSSIAGRFAQPILGPYCSSKFAMEAMSDALRRELRSQRIGVSIVEPGAIQSEIWRKAQEEVAAKESSNPDAGPYDYLVHAVKFAAFQAAENAIPAERVSRVVERCLTSRKAPIRTLVGPDAKLMAAAKAILPTAAIDALLEFGLRRLSKKTAHAR